MSELNPNHPVTRQMHDSWHKIALLVMKKQGLREVVITMNDLADVGDGEWAIAIQELSDGLHVRLLTMEEGIALAKKEGGLPV